MHGAHGRFNRLQWRLDGTERLVDRVGRTEEEAEEEVVGIPFEPRLPEEDEGEVISNPSIKPVWLLRFFTNWGAMWGARTRHQANGDAAEKPADQVGNGSSIANSPSPAPIEDTATTS